tara:strand:+ start:289 stop:834 length:546 start_codon:yes stop_codon:yes gene_type:complete
MKKMILLLFVAFFVGLTVGNFVIPDVSFTGQAVTDVVEESPIIEEKPVEVPYREPIGGERASPSDRVNTSQIKQYRNEVRLRLTNTTIAEFKETNSMDPLLDSGAHGIQLPVKSADEVFVGDIIAYETLYDVPEIVLHRVVEIGEDEEGWYAIFKGDNNAFVDYDKVRFSQIRYVLVGILY